MTDASFCYMFTTSPKKVLSNRFDLSLGEYFKKRKHTRIRFCISKTDYRSRREADGSVGFVLVDGSDDGACIRACEKLAGLASEKNYLRVLACDHDASRDLIREALSLGMGLLLVSGDADLKTVSELVSMHSSAGADVVAGLENECVLLGAMDVIAAGASGIVAGTGYLSDAEKLADSLGEFRYQSMMSAVSSEVKAAGRLAFSAPKICCFDKAGQGDKSAPFGMLVTEMMRKRKIDPIIRYYGQLPMMEYACEMAERGTPVDIGGFAKYGQAKYAGDF